MPTNSLIDMYDIIDHNIPCQFDFKIGQKVIIHDTNNKTMKSIEIKYELLHELNTVMIPYQDILVNHYNTVKYTQK